MQPDKKKALAALIIAKARPQEMESDEGGEEQSHDEGVMEACGEMIDAMKRGDASALASALAAYMDMRS
jgi:hypothetical protein